MSGTGRKRVWRTARAERDGTGFSVMLDEAPLRLPSGAVLAVPEPALARAVAAEWADAGGGAPGGALQPDALRLTQLAAARQERVAPDRDRMVEHLLGYLDGDTLRYRAAEDGPLRFKQDRAWDPWLLRWAERTGTTLPVVSGVMPSPAGTAATGRGRDLLAATTDAELTALAVLVPALGSLLLALAVVDGALEAREALGLSMLDEHDQRARWGAVSESEERETILDRDVAAAETFLRLARTGTEPAHAG